MVNHLKYGQPTEIKARNEGEDNKTILAQEEIRSQIVKKKMILFEAKKKRSNHLLSYVNYNQTQISSNQWNQRGLFQTQDYLPQNSKTD